MFSACWLRFDAFVCSDILYQDPIATYNPLHISNLTNALPEIHFSDYFSAFAHRSYPEQVIVTYPAYPESLSTILKDTPPAVVEGYLVISAALRLAPLLGSKTEAWKAVREMDETLGGIKKGAVGDRDEYCVGKVESALGFAVGRYFVNETFGGESREKGTRVITGERIHVNPFALLNVIPFRHYQIVQILTKLSGMDG